MPYKLNKIDEFGYNYTVRKILALYDETIMVFDNWYTLKLYAQYILSLVLFFCLKCQLKVSWALTLTKSLEITNKNRQ